MFGFTNDSGKGRYGTIPTDDYPFETESQHSKAKRESQTANIIFGTLCVVLVVGTLAVTGNKLRSTTVITKVHSSLKGSEGSLTEVSDINFSLKRTEYDALPYFNTDYTSLLQYAFLKGFKAVIEPYNSMELYFYEPYRGINNFEYEICSTKSNECQKGYYYDYGKSTASKSFVKFACTPYETYSMTLYTLKDNKEKVSYQKSDLVCLYVRRELRTLTKKDKEAFLDASFALTKYSDEEGKEKFGSKYRSTSYLVKIHHFNAAQQNADHIHDGNGFITQHLKITNIFDDSLQSVDPAMSLPYWDFTIDSAQGKQAYDCEVIQSTMYGSMTMPADITNGFQYSTDKIESAKVPDGRWKEITVEKNTYYEDLNYGYGYLRGPWNMNPSPYMSRFGFDFSKYNVSLDLPTCTSHYEALQVTDLMDYVYQSAYDPHSLTHTMIGGIYGCDKFDKMYYGGYVTSLNDARAMCAAWSFTIKELWRWNYIEPKSGCIVNTEDLRQSSCGFTALTSSETIGNFLLQMSPDTITTTKSDWHEAWLNFIEGDGGMIFAGDQLESASTGDPSFWVIHPTLERLFQAKFMAGGFVDETWASDAKNDYVCDKSACYSTDVGYIDYFSDCCYGHYETDQLYDPIGDKVTKTGLTNREVITATDPRRQDYSMNYIYDKFDWSHCDEDFNALLEELKAQMDNKQGKYYTGDAEITKHIRASRAARVKFSQEMAAKSSKKKSSKSK